MKFLRYLAVLVVLLIVAIWRAAHPSGEFVVNLVFGWITFLGRVSSKAEIRWDGLTIFAMAFFGAILVAHYFISNISRQMKAEGEPKASRWRWRSTVILITGVVVMFAAGISFIGVVHQTGWMLNSKTPLYGKSARERDSLQWQMRLIAMASDLAMDIYDDFPGDVTNSEGKAIQGWAVNLLPYLGAGYFSEELDRTEPWDAPVNESTFKKFLPELINPRLSDVHYRDERGYCFSHYAGNSHLFRPTNQPNRLTAMSGRSNLLFIGEVNTGFVPWGKPGNYRDPTNGFHTPNGFGGPATSTGTLFIMADGSTRMINHEIDPVLLQRMSIPEKPSNASSLQKEKQNDGER